MEPFAIVGLVGTIAQFIDYTTRLIGRLDDFRASAKNAPNVFESVRKQLELLRINLAKINTTQLDDRTQKALDVAVKDCLHQAKRIEAMRKKVEPNGGDSKMQRAAKIVTSLYQDKEIKEISVLLNNWVLHLIHHQTLINQPSMPARPTPLRSVSFSIMPFDRDENFSGRKEHFQRLDELFAGGGRAALYGLGGIGKSQIAIEYSHRFLEKHPGAMVLWVYASSIARIEEAYQQIATKAQLPGSDDPTVPKYELVSTWLREEAENSWLLVLDNADMEDTFFSPLDSTVGQCEPKTMKDFIPTAKNGHALITSRSRDIATKLTHRARVVEVSKLNESEGRELLQKAIGDPKLNDELEVRELLDALEHLPLAIAQAAAFIDKNDITIADYLGMLKNDNQKVIKMLSDRLKYSRHDRTCLKSVIASWHISFDYLRQKAPDAANLLSLMSMFDGKLIPQRLLSAQIALEMDFFDAIGMLKSFSLISESSDSVRGSNEKRKQYTVHRLIHLATRVWVEKEGDADKWHQTALDTMVRFFPAGNSDDWAICNELEPHSEFVLDYDTQEEEYLLRMIDLLLRSARDRYHQRHSQEAMRRASRALAMSRTISTEHAQLQVAKSLTMISWCHFADKNWDSAVTASEEALILFEKHLGKDAAEVMQARSRLSKFLMKSGQLDRANEIQVALLEVQRQKFGEENEDVLFTMNRLVATLKKLKQYNKALSMSEELLAIRCRVYGENHPDTLSALSNHAELLKVLERIDEAINVMQRAYNGFVEQYGEDRQESKDAFAYIQEWKTEQTEKINSQTAEVLGTTVVDQQSQNILQDGKQVEVTINVVCDTAQLAG